MRVCSQGFLRNHFWAASKLSMRACWCRHVVCRRKEIFGGGEFELEGMRLLRIVTNIVL